MISNVYRIPIKIDSYVVDSINLFLKDITDTLEPVDINHICKFNNIDYKIILNFSGIRVQEYHRICTINISIYKNNKIFIQDTMLVYTLLDLFKILNLKANDNELFLIKLLEDSNDEIKLFQQTIKDLTKGKCLDEESVIDQILYKSFTNKVEGMELCFVLLFRYKNLTKSKDIEMLLKEKLSFIGYDEDYLLNSKKKKQNSSYNVYINTLVLILEILYKKRELDIKQSRDTSLNRINLFFKLLVEEKYFEII